MVFASGGVAAIALVIALVISEWQITGSIPPWNLLWLQSSLPKQSRVGCTSLSFSPKTVRENSLFNEDGRSQIKMKVITSR